MFRSTVAVVHNSKPLLKLKVFKVTLENIETSKNKQM